jgi:hypothetical protein
MMTLRSLVLDETQVTDAALEDIGQLTNLEEWLGLRAALDPFGNWVGAALTRCISDPHAAARSDYLTSNGCSRPPPHKRTENLW